MKLKYIITALVVIAAILWFIPDVRNVIKSEQGTPTPSVSPTPTSADNGRMIGEAVAVRDHAMIQYNVSLDQILIMSAESVQWPNGCLGLPKPDEMCTEALVQGWSVTIKLKDTSALHTYRTNTGATVIRQES